MIKREQSKKESTVKVTFVQPVNGAKPPAVVGDFNGWNPAQGKMTKRSNGTASLSVALEPGKSYRFRYMKEDGTWYNDEAADDYAPNQYGSVDCVVQL